MEIRQLGLVLLFLFLASVLIPLHGSNAAPLPKATQKMLKEYNLDASDV